MADRPLVLADFDYELPAGLIAQEPVGVRGESRLLVVDRAAAGSLGGKAAREPLRDAMFGDLAGLIPAGDLLVLNSTRVRHARLLGTRPSGGDAEVLLIHPGTADTWIAMGRPGSAMRPGKRIRLGEGVFVETIEVLDDGNRVVKFVGTTADDAVRRFGQLPLPPYITHAPGSLDEERYQTVYARREGSVAAPTAGLHFTNDLLERLTGGGVHIADLDLEVGPGTFKPVESASLSGHVMHAERYEVPASLVRAVAETRAAGGHVWAVGTTVVRALESAADDTGVLRAGASETALFVTPGYQFRVVDHLITNFHLPRSTLLMLVSAFAGYETAMAAYRHAVAARYRFYSYGDAMVVL